MHVSKHQPRHRSATVDPFNDPSNISYSSYGVPTLSRNAPLASPPVSRQPPPPPPKHQQQLAKPHPSSHRHRPPPVTNRENIMDAVRDTVTVVRSGTTDQSPRTRMGRSQTELPPPTNVRPAPPPVSRRSQSQDSVARAANAMEKSKQSGRPRPKKGSSHADVIDRLDFSGVGPMFHHDGPFDACAPSRNRHRAKAPMFAWSAATDADREALASAREVQPRGFDSPYPTSPDIYVPYEAPKKKHDAIAEAWGIHEPEPFEDFSAGGGVTSRPSGEYPRSNGNGTTKRTKDGRDARDVYREYLDEHHPSPSRRQPTSKRALPPPQPIFVPESDLDNNPPSPTSAGVPSSPGAGGTPRRSKSIMQRIRKMRDAPNVPVGQYEEEDARGRDTSPGSSGKKAVVGMRGSVSQGPPPARPTHRSQASFPGRYARSPNGQSPPSDEAFVYVDHVPVKKDKSLPTPPKDGYTPNENSTGYFDPENSVGSAGGGAGLGRKTSLLKKVRGVVKGGPSK
ncbi:hypothetical protein GY45DRAFT_1241087 [Cubamyces sp. BRFM 1775]|nr:hypothetical protein GY45DRAFT_1241087 [Cubamyces sp. BRFM 1775]